MNVQTQPVWLLVAVAVLTELGGAVTLFAADMTTAGILVAVGALLTGVGGKLAQSIVTPLARPRDDLGRPLVPVPLDRDESWSEPDPAGEGA